MRVGVHLFATDGAVPAQASLAAMDRFIQEIARNPAAMA